MRNRFVRILTAIGALALVALPVEANGQSALDMSSSSAPHLVTPVLSARRVPDFLRTRVADEALNQSITQLLRDAPASTCVVVSDNGRILVRVNGDLPLVPASTNKLLTANAVLDRLGPQSRLATVVRASRPPGPDGVVDGDLFLVGGGDPLLFTEGFRVTLKDRNQPQTDFAQLADRIKAAGITEIRGNIVADDSRYDSLRNVPSWPPSYQKEGAVGALSALEVNRGETGLSADPDKPAKIRRLGDPPTLGAEPLASLLRQRGVKVTGRPVAGTAPEQAIEIARLESLPLKDLVAEMLTWSDNTTAELLTKELGLQAVGEGSTSAGTEVIRANTIAEGLPEHGLSIVDGSGLDRGNRLTCDLLVALLDHEGSDSLLAQGLAVAGRSGTLRTRFRGSPAEGRVRAKTGTLSDVHALAGYVDASDGTQLTFAVILNGQIAADRPIEDEIAQVFIGYPEAPAASALGPKPPT
ncbi:MAG: D-alanyl-D-alanine carboxypeptidase/D-alanyl-D-alanine-endopeptidase [Acidimicrobiales bacterium]|nr:D-alanyl-D-alanine carboxypeptidase/D-alanyl-D-alanine-endopeptidase [Acidimicrobiales bacterium]